MTAVGDRETSPSPFHDALTRADHGEAPVSGDISALGETLVAQRLARWRRDLGEDIHGPGRLERRLALEGCDLDRARRILAKPPTGERPRLWTQATTVLARSDLARHGQISEVQEGDLPFVDLWRPIAAWVATSWWEDLALDQRERISPEVRKDREHTLLRRLAHLGADPLWQLFVEARDPVAMVQRIADPAALAPRERYRCFLGELAASRLEPLVEIAGVLVRHVVTSIEQWRSASSELVDRLVRHRRAISSALGIAAEGESLVLERVASGHGDSHRGGRSVAVVAYRDPAGTLHRCVYKPKDLELEAFLGELLGSIDTGEDAPLRAPRVFTGDGWGVAEFIDATPPRDSEALRRFYRNAGRLLAVLFVLGESDAHLENLIACDDQLVPIDAETLLGARVREGLPAADARTDTTPPPPDDARFWQIDESVMRVGLLPSWRLVGPRRTPLDVSVLGAGATPPRSNLHRGWRDLNTDAMLRQPAPAPETIPACVPGGINRTAEHVDEIVAGLSDELARIVAAREDWLGPTGHLERGRGRRGRIVLRNTRVYAILREGLVTADALRDEAAQGLAIEPLARAWLHLGDPETIWAFLRSEIEQLATLDLPMFDHRIGETALDLGSGRLLEGLLDHDGLSIARARLASLTPELVDFQRRLARGSLRSRFMSDPRDLEMLDEAAIDEGPKGSLAETPEVEHLDVAVATRRILDEVVAAALDDGQGTPRWLGVDLIGDTARHGFGILNASLYGGTAGIALALAAGERGDLANRAVAALIELARAEMGLRRRWWRDQSLGLAGAGGQLLTLALLAERSPDSSTEYRCALDALIEALDGERIRHEHTADVLGGLAGLLGALIRIETPKSLELALAAADRILELQTPYGAWATAQGELLAGFSHGASGIVAVLGGVAPLVSALGDRNACRLRDAIRRGIDFETTLFDPHEGNWRDRRAGRSGTMTSWCHGAPGVALARMALGELLTDAHEDEITRWRVEAEIALDTTARTRRRSRSLCCGAPGRAVILALGGRHDEARRTLAVAVAGHQRLDGSQVSEERPGLFTGTAGLALAGLDIELATAVLSAGVLGRRP